MQDLAIEVLKRPIYLLVPSHSLRDHLLESLARTQGGLAGVGCFTLRALAHDILERCGESPPQGSWMLPVLVRRAAQQHPPLRSCLDHLHDGYSTLVRPVIDLLEAGLDPAHGAAFDEVLAEEGRLVASVADVQRARSLVEVAIRVQEEMDERGLGHASSLLQRATEILRTRQDLDLPSSGFHVFGFADATGVATDLIEAVLLRYGGTVYLDHAPDPANPRDLDPSFEFSRRFATRLTDLGQPTREATTTDPPEIHLVSALGGQAEIREIGWRIRRLLDDGVAPEQIGVVARQLEPYRSGLRRHFSRLSIPFSALGANGPLLPKGRRVRALVEILNLRERVRLERWLDARTRQTGQTRDFDLRLAMFGLGVSRLHEMADLRHGDALRGESYALPVRLGFAADDESALRLPRRQVSTADLLQAREQAAALCEHFETWQRSRSWTDHLDQFDRLLRQLGWSDSEPAKNDLDRALERLTRGVPQTLELGLDEFARVVTDALSTVGLGPLGGLGGGVQILDVTEARGRTFGHLFLMGMNKGMFPRAVREDPTLPDTLRRVLGREGHGVLPDLAVKRAGFAEERFLFAQLCAASPNVTLSWQVADDDNRELTTSPLVERLLWERDEKRVSSPQTLGPATDLKTHPRTLFESAIRAALGGGARQLKAGLTAAQPPDLSPSPELLAAARICIFSELDRPAGEGSLLGPYFGFVGAAADVDDPRLANDLYVTTLERLAACPWQTFLVRVLRLEALPDPVEILPGLDALLIGQLVHRVLERVIKEPIREPIATLAEARSSTPVATPWPEEARLRRLLQSEAIAVSRDQGITWKGFDEVLAHIALPFLAEARALLWLDSSPLGPVAAELGGQFSLSQGATDRELHFKADRIDSGAGNLLLSDYKTGRRSLSQAKTAKTRNQHLIKEIRRGRWLQAVAYARAAGGTDDAGRYVFLHPEFEGQEEARTLTIGAADREAQAAFDIAIDRLMSAWLAGTFFPRLVDPDTDEEPRACDYCDVAEACLRGDSGVRGRLREWSRQRQASTPTEKAFLDAWLLASNKEPQP